MSRLLLRPATWAQVEQKIRLVPQYRDPGRVSLQPVHVRPADTSPLCLLARVHRLERVVDLIAAYQEQSIPLFEGVWAQPGDGRRFLIAPPILELHRDRRVIIDGIHRLFGCLTRAPEPVLVAVVSGVKQELPADIVDWSQVTLTDRQTERREKFRNLDEARFREINRWIDDGPP